MGTPWSLIFIFYFILFFVFSKAAPTAYGSSQARGLIGAVVTGLRHSHSKAGSDLHLQPTPQLTATPDPSCICDLYHSSRPRQILNSLSKARDQTRILMDTSRVC